MLFLHGFPEFWYAWRHQLADLSDSHLCVAPDTRGINLSERPQSLEAYSIAQLVEDARQLIQHFGGGKAIVVGHDWGGFMSWELAIRHPEVIDRLVIINCAHSDIYQRLLIDSEAHRRASQYTVAFRSEAGEALVGRDDFAGFRTHVLEPAVAAGTLDQAGVEAYLAAWRQPGAMTAGLNYYRANRLGPPADGGPPPKPRGVAATRIDLPTLVIWGEQDPYFALECLDPLPQYCTDLRLERFPNNGHFIVNEIPDQVTALIRGFAAGG